MERKRLKKHLGARDGWKWSRSKSKEVRVYGNRQRTVCFHPNWSNGTAAARGSRPLNDPTGVSRFWEIRTSSRIFGTSMMFGIGTRRTRMHSDSFTNLLGEDGHSWGLSHKGTLWHDGRWRPFCRPFRENEATTIGMWFDAVNGTLSYFKDEEPLGIAFEGLDKVDAFLYPMVASTAAKTEMLISSSIRSFISLKDRCRQVITDNLTDVQDVRRLQIPSILQSYVIDEDEEEIITEELDPRPAPNLDPLLHALATRQLLKASSSSIQPPQQALHAHI